MQLKKLITKYKFPLDATYIEHIENTDTKEILHYYYNQVKDHLDYHLDDLTKEKLSDLSIQAVQERMQFHGIPSDIVRSSLNHFREMHKKAQKYGNLAKGVSYQGLFFAPDIICSSWNLILQTV